MQISLARQLCSTLPVPFVLLNMFLFIAIFYSGKLVFIFIAIVIPLFWKHILCIAHLAYCVITSWEILCLEKSVEVLRLALMWTFFHWALARWGSSLYDISTELFISCFFRRLLLDIITMELLVVKVRINM